MNLRILGMRLVGKSLPLPIFTLALLGVNGAAVAQHPAPAPNPPQIAEASEDAANAMQLFQLPAGVTGEVYAAEPLMANPVAIDVDLSNRVLVCETYRQGKGVEDNRSHGHWLDDDLAAQTVEDRIAYIKKHLGNDAKRYTEHDDLIRMLWDEDRDGIADHSSVFANRFNSIEEGTGAGVIRIGNDVYFTCIPRLWKITDSDNDGISDSRQALHEGYGVRFAFRGHDLHGLIIGPDGRLYFSIGDRGYHVNNQVSDPSSGAVFRCELDGSQLEVVATGLRNPQELAFDEFGNLFTGDNNSDSGDRARMVYIVPDSDSGWRMHYQYLPDRGPFNREKIWHPYDPQSTPAYIVPPIDNFADGPSGFAYYPGTGFSDHMQRRFLLCDFRGQASGSGIKTFRLAPKGAFWEIKDEENSFWNMLATDCCFGPDGRLYVSDWVHGWNGIGKGRIYAFTDNNADAALKSEVARLLGGDWSEWSNDDLIGFLNHQDQRVRQQAQFELVNREEIKLLNGALLDPELEELARIHALWGLGQLARQESRIATNEVGLACSLLTQSGLEILRTSKTELKNQTAKLIGDLAPRLHWDISTKKAWQNALLGMVQSDEPRSQFFAAPALATFGELNTCRAILELLTVNDNEDPLLRHAGILSLVNHSRHHNHDLLRQAAENSNLAVKLASVVAIRKLLEVSEADGEELITMLSGLLDSQQPAISLEAARLVYDLPVEDLLPKLASFATQPNLPDPLARRVLNANFRVGSQECIDRVQAYAMDNSQIEDRRVEAVQMLASWNTPPNRDRVLGCWRPFDLENRSTNALKSVEILFDQLNNLSEKCRNELMNSVATLKIQGLAPKLMQVWQTANTIPEQRATLQCLLSLNASESKPAALMGLGHDDAEIRIMSLNFLADQNAPEMANFLTRALKSDTIGERQNAIALLGRSGDENLRTVLRTMLIDLNNMPADSQLDVVMAAAQSTDQKMADLAKELLRMDGGEAQPPRYELALSGGNAERGSEIFYNRAEVYCLRCHKIDSSGGDVGPNLTTIGSQRDREYLLESLVEPNKVIAENFETVVVLDLDGKIHVGVPKASTDETLSIMTAEAIMVNIPKDEIDEIRRGESAMPNDVIKHLTMAELRDLIEFLATRKE